MRFRKYIKSLCRRIRKLQMPRKTMLKYCNTGRDIETYVYFRSNRLGLWRHILKPGFQHVGVFYDHNGSVLNVDFRPNHLEVGTATHSIADHIEKLKKLGYTIIHGHTKPTKILTNNFPYSIAPFNCIAVTKALLAIKEPQCWTAWKLYKILVSKHQFKEL